MGQGQPDPNHPDVATTPAEATQAPEAAKQEVEASSSTQQSGPAQPDPKAMPRAAPPEPVKGEVDSRTSPCQRTTGGF